ncbi:unnamed protein product [Dibothriocephalus latus]|uniref:Uncharacterized protein n=1 Tax=Dibothriocephalus latus TaxID=60516 RepID=A0A3P7P0W6_DIBLA|nr:unnamed protein product [Dibothriocephalus latus]
MNPQNAKQWRPLLIGHLIFLLIRGADSVGAEDQVTGILTNAIQAIRNVAKQYSGEDEYLQRSGASEEQQREWRAYVLQNYDLNPFWPVLSDLSVLIFHVCLRSPFEVHPPYLLYSSVHPIYA